MRATMPLLLLLLVVGATISCGRSEAELAEGAVGFTDSDLATGGGEAVEPAALQLTGSAFEAAGELELPERAAQELDGLHHVYELSENIISGAEPNGARAFEELARLGVRTILSVDGKTPDAELAERHGLRYVHVPIQYKGITGDEQARILKTFRELEGPFYVHCFHGVHRGPAAAALGRIALDDVPREVALAEMRQWCGTSSKYEGLYQTVATAQLPTRAQTEALDYAFDPATPLGGTVSFMVEIARPFDRIKGIANNAWKVQADHPDLDPVNEAAILAQLLERAPEIEDLHGQPDDFTDWLEASGPQARALHGALREAREQDDPKAWAAAQGALDTLSATCNSCHAVYRN